MFLRRQIERRIAAYQVGLLERYYSEVESMYQTMRGWRHDYRHHIQTLKAHMAQKEYATVESYLDMLDEDLTKVAVVLRTGNRMADAILNSKLSLAKRQGIAVKATAAVPVKLDIPELDLSVIIGNLLDNAIEACMELPDAERLIRIYIAMKGKHLYVSISNTALGPKKVKIRNRFNSSKGSGHGLGLARIDALVEKYSGYITRASEEGAFTTELLLPAVS